MNRHPDTKAPVAEQKETIKGIESLPAFMQNILNNFVYVEIPRIRFAVPDRKPREKWVLSEGESLYDGLRKAKHEAGEGIEIPQIDALEAFDKAIKHID